MNLHKYQYRTGGKKSLLTIGAQPVAKEAAEAMERFNNWFSANYAHISNRLKQNGHFDEAILSDTYINIYKRLAIKGEKIHDYGIAFFLQNYYLCAMRVKCKRESIEIVSIDKLVNICGNGEPPGRALDIEILKSEVIKYVRKRHKGYKLNIFNRHLDAKACFSRTELSQIMGYKNETIVCCVLSEIERDIRAKFGKQKQLILEY